MLARLRRFAVLVPILLLAIVLLAWTRSYLPDQTFFRSHQGRVLVFFASGSYAHWFDPSSPEFTASDRAVDYSRRVAKTNSLPSFQFLGFEWTDLNFKSGFPGFIAIPYWAISLLLVALSAWSIVRLRSQRQRSLPGHCRACGYDLRGSSGRCPECGHEPSPSAPTTPTAAVG